MSTSTHNRTAPLASHDIAVRSYQTAARRLTHNTEPAACAPHPSSVFGSAAAVATSYLAVLGVGFARLSIFTSNITAGRATGGLRDHWGRPVVGPAYRNRTVWT